MVRHNLLHDVALGIRTAGRNCSSNLRDVRGHGIVALVRRQPCPVCAKDDALVACLPGSLLRHGGANLPGLGKVKE